MSTPASHLPPDVLALLVGLNEEIERLNKQYNISRRGAEIWHAEVDIGKFLIVTADGLGRGTMVYGRGQGGDDYLQLEVRVFENEHKACALASTCLEKDGGVNMERLMAAFDDARTPESHIVV